MPLNVGDVAPDFELMNQDRGKVKLSAYRGKKNVMLLFYPMDFSPICTDEFCTFGPQKDKLSGKDGDTVVFGINCDTPFCHEAFRKQYDIPFDLLADTSREVVKAYGMFSGVEPFNCSKRGTVVIDKAGKVTKYEEVGMGDRRNVDDLAQAALVEDLLEQRDNEGGERIGASR